MVALYSGQGRVLSTKSQTHDHVDPEPVELASPPCSLHEIDPAYSGLGRLTTKGAVTNDPAGASPSEAGSVALRLDAELLAALDQGVVDRAQGLSRADAAADALRDWLTDRGNHKRRGDPEAAT